MPSSRSRPVITLTTDFGTTDHYVGSMKCVIASICPDAHLIDITHEIAPADLVSASYAISQAAPFSPPGSIHVLVIDPGVGTDRKAIALRAGDQTYIAPDNGVLSLVAPDPAELAAGDAVRELSNPKLWLPSPSQTFHGRDLFAPAAAQLAAGNVPWEELGAPMKSCIVLPGLRPVETEGRWEGLVLSIDHFGNVITNLPLLPGGQSHESLVLHVNGHSVRRFQRTFGEKEPGAPFLYRGSSGYIEIAINRGRAAAALGARVGDRVELEIHA